MSDQTINGIPVADCKALVETVAEDRSEGHTTWHSVTEWNGGFECESQIREHTLQMDEPEELGGTDEAPNMVENVLAAYGSCLTVGYSLNASVRGIPINDLRVEVEGALDLAGFFGIDDEVPAGFSKIEATVYLDAEADEEELQALHEQVLATSPVGSILTRPLDVETTLETEKSPAEQAAAKA